MKRKPAKASTWIAIRSRKRGDAVVLYGGWRQIRPDLMGAASYRVPAGLDVSLLDPPALIALADRLTLERQHVAKAKG